MVGNGVVARFANRYGSALENGSVKRGKFRLICAVDSG